MKSKTNLDGVRGPRGGPYYPSVSIGHRDAV
jgi:hypothetical protein